MRRLVLGVLLLSLSAALFAQDPALRFDVAAIRPSNPSARGMNIDLKVRDFIAINTSLADFILLAHSLHPKQIVGMQPWMETEKWDITAKAPGPSPPSEP